MYPGYVNKSTRQHELEMGYLPRYRPRPRTRTRPRPLHDKINLFLQRRQSILLSFINTHPYICMCIEAQVAYLPTAPAPAHSRSQYQPPSPPPYKDTPSPALASNNSNKPVSRPDSASSSDGSSDMLRRCVICPGSRSVASFIHRLVLVFILENPVSKVWEGVVWFWFLGLIAD